MECTWGTVCGDGAWGAGGRSNAQIVCRQLELSSQSKLKIYLYVTACVHLHA